MGSTKETPLDLETIANYQKNLKRPYDFFREQKLVTQTCMEGINKYCDLSNKFTECTLIHGFLGSGKTISK